MRFATAATALAVFGPTCVHSFNPTWGYNVGLEWAEWIRQFTNSAGFSLLDRPHEAMTKDGVLSKYPLYFGIPKTSMTPTMHRAVQDIVRGSIDTDDHEGGEDPRYRVKGEAENAHAYCDDEKIGECHKRLQDMQQEILSLLQVGDVGWACRLGPQQTRPSPAHLARLLLPQQLG